VFPVFVGLHERYRQPRSKRNKWALKKRGRSGACLHRRLRADHSFALFEMSHCFLVGTGIPRGNEQI
jgi:hypothetical protein